MTALFLVLIAWHRAEYQDKYIKFILIYLALCNISNIINPNSLGEFCYILDASIDALMIITLIKYNPPTLLINILFISMVFNGLSFIEFNSNYTFFYNLYAPIMYLLMSTLVYLAFKGGLEDGSDSTYNGGTNDTICNDSNSGVSTRTTQ